MSTRTILITVGACAACLAAIPGTGVVWALRQPGLPLQPTPDFTASDTSVRISMRDSSVAPNYHRSFTIEVDEQTAWIQVRTYGVVVAAKRVALADGYYRDWLARHRPDLAWLARHPGPRDLGGCAGGRTFSVEFWSGEKKTFADGFEACGNEGQGAADRVTGLSDDIRKLFGDGLFFSGRSFAGQTSPAPLEPQARPDPAHRPTGGATPQPTTPAPSAPSAPAGTRPTATARPAG